MSLSKPVAKVILPFAFTIIGICCLLALVFTFVKPQMQMLTQLSQRNSGCVRSDFLSSTDGASSGTVGCDSMGTNYTEYYCQDPKGCQAPDGSDINANEIFFGSKIVKSACKPQCVINQWNLSVARVCQYQSQIDGHDCITSGEVAKEKITYTCDPQDLKGIPGCVITGDQTFLKQFLDQSQGKCKALSNNATTLMCDTGTVVTVTQNCQLETDLPICGEYLVRSKLIKVPDPDAPVLEHNDLNPAPSLPDSDPRTNIYKKCSHKDSLLLNLSADCYSIDQSQKYSGVADLFRIGVSREPTYCVGFDRETKEQVLANGSNAIKCKQPSSYTASYLPGNLDYDPVESTTPNPDCFRVCMYYAPPTDLTPTDVQQFGGIIGRYFVMIANLTIDNVVKRFIVSYYHSPNRTQSYLGQKSPNLAGEPFGDALGKGGDYTDPYVFMTLIDLEEVMANYQSYNIMNPSICTEAVLTETNAMIFAADVSTTSVGPAGSKDLELLGYNQNKLGFIGVRPIEQLSGTVFVYPYWSPISSNVSAALEQDPPAPLESALTIRFNYLGDIPADSYGPARKKYSLQATEVVTVGIPFPMPSPITNAPIHLFVISKKNPTYEIDISANNPSVVNFIEIYDVGNRVTNFQSVNQVVDIPKIIGSRIQRTPQNCNLFFRLPVPSDYG